MNKRILLLIVLQTFMLVYMVANKQWTLMAGDPIVLETQPIDPRSLFRGDYVVLNYTISRIDLDQVQGDKFFQADDKVYVTVKQQGDYWQAVAVHRNHPKPASGEKVIRGRVKYVNSNRWRRHRPVKEVKSINIVYGIENYFVPEGEGRDLERRMPDKKVTIQVAVDGFGRVAIKSVLVNGVAAYTESLF